jgi:hypothetical protein
MRCYHAAMLAFAPLDLWVILVILAILFWNRWPPSFPPRFHP